MGAGNLEAVGMVTPTLAHMGGIDEIGVFLIPALLAILVLRWAEKRARQRPPAGDDNDPPVSSPRLQEPVTSSQELNTRPESGDRRPNA